VFGGKITTYRKLAEAAVNKIVPYFENTGPAWTENAPLPGGDFTHLAVLTNAITKQYPWLPLKLRTRMIRNYGTRITDVLGAASSLQSLGQMFGADLYEQEVNFLIEREWANKVEDIIWRRTKLGLYLSAQQVNDIKEYLLNQTAILARKSSALTKVA